MFRALIIICILWMTPKGLDITCGGKKHQPAFDSSIFGGCFVVKNDITFEILGKPPANISGSYGTMFLNSTYDCVLRMNLKTRYTGDYRCGVLFITHKNETVKAIFSHFTIDEDDWNHKVDTHKENSPIMENNTGSFHSLHVHLQHNRIIMIAFMTSGITLAGLTLMILRTRSKVREQDFPLTTLNSPGPHQSASYSYPTTPRERNEANHALSSLEFIIAPSPPPLSLSFSPEVPADYSTDQYNQHDCHCIDRLL